LSLCSASGVSSATTSSATTSSTVSKSAKILSASSKSLVATAAAKSIIASLTISSGRANQASFISFLSALKPFLSPASTRFNIFSSKVSSLVVGGIASPLNTSNNLLNPSSTSLCSASVYLLQLLILSASIRVILRSGFSVLIQFL
jgi:hypothetical protein